MIEKFLKAIFEKIYKFPPEVMSIAPGRINIIGEHTDYNLGYVLPAAIDMRVYFLASRRKDESVFMRAENFREEENFVLKNISVSKPKKWINYIKGVLWALQKEGSSLQGLNGLVWGDIPLEAGLSSSAALEVSIINGLDELFHLHLEPEKKAFLAQKAENDFVGVKCGLMDQFISIFGQKNKALYLDCENLRFDLIPLHLNKENIGFIAYDTRVRRRLSSSQYNQRRKESAEALVFLEGNGYRNFKEVGLETLEKMRSRMKKVIFKRAKHVISENARVMKAVEALREDNFLLLKELLFLSHESLRDDYEVSCPELDLLYETGKEFAGCLGARLTGAGFGGSGIALLKKPRIAAFKKKLLEKAERNRFPRPEIYEIKFGEGARVYSQVKEDKR
ncbi:MAG: galactokinase [Candidatus Aminicenantes bacterium]|nr:galactokinase [Candidatus Aminicenantes bacterium]